MIASGVGVDEYNDERDDLAGRVRASKIASRGRKKRDGEIIMLSLTRARVAR